MTENMGYRKYRTRRPWLRAGAPLVLVLVGLVAAVAVARAGDPLGRNTKGSGERVGGHRVLDEREPIVGLAAVDHEANADAPEEAGLTVVRPEHACRCCMDRHLATPYLNRQCVR